MPFGNMDSEKIEARKGLLETFLKVGGLWRSCDRRSGVEVVTPRRLFQHLCAVSEITNSEEMQEFLALNTDARIAFVKKPFIVSRIDKVERSLRSLLRRSPGSRDHVLLMLLWLRSW